MRLISIDTGNRLVKTPRHHFNAGVVNHGPRPPAIMKDMVKYNGIYYSITDQRVPYRKDKTEDDSYFLLTLFGIAKELLGNSEATTPPIAEDLCLAVGLPPSHLPALKEKYANYFLTAGEGKEIVLDSALLDKAIEDAKALAEINVLTGKAKNIEMDISQFQHSVTILEWNACKGAAVKKGDVLFTYGVPNSMSLCDESGGLMEDIGYRANAVYEYKSPDDGVLRTSFIDKGNAIVLGRPVALMGVYDEDIAFNYNDTEFLININKVLVYPQGFAAAVDLLPQVEKYPRSFIIDIGGWTTDVVMLAFGEPDMSFCESFNFGVIEMCNQIKRRISHQFDADLEDSHIESCLRGNETLPKHIRDTIATQAGDYCTTLLRELKERGVDIAINIPIFIGGGSALFRAKLEKYCTNAIFNTDVHANANGYETFALATQEDLVIPDAATNAIVAHEGMQPIGQAVGL